MVLLLQSAQKLKILSLSVEIQTQNEQKVSFSLTKENNVG